MSKHSRFITSAAISLIFLLPVLSQATSLEEQLQKLRETGIPTTVEELNLPDIPDEENARFLYEKAGELQRSLFEKHRELWNYFPLSGLALVSWDEVPEEKKKSVIGYILNDPEFNRLCDMLYKAATMKCRFWSVEKYSHLLAGATGMSNTVANMRQFARTLADKARIEAEHGDANVALSTALTGLKLGEAFSNDPLVIMFLIRLALESVALNNLQDVVANMPCRDSATQEQDTSAYKDILIQLNAKKLALEKQLIASNIIESGLRFEHFKNLGENIFELSEHERKMIEMARSHHEAGGSHIPTPEVIEKNYREAKELLKKDFVSSELKNVKEFIEQQEILYLSLMNKVIPLMQQLYHETMDELNSFFEETERELEERYLLRYISNPLAMRRMLSQYLQYKAFAGAAEIGLANIIYRQEHGRFVDSLAQLAPDILPALPPDPFTGKDYIYRKTDLGFIVYSVGENLTDDGGIHRWSKEGREKGSTDIIWGLNYRDLNE